MPVEYALNPYGARAALERLRKYIVTSADALRRAGLVVVQFQDTDTAVLMSPDATPASREIVEESSRGEDEDVAAALAHLQGYIAQEAVAERETERSHVDLVERIRRDEREAIATWLEAKTPKRANSYAWKWARAIRAGSYRRKVEA